MYPLVAMRATLSIVICAAVVSNERASAFVSPSQDLRERAAQFVDADLSERDVIYQELSRDAHGDARAILLAALEARYESKFTELAALPSYPGLVAVAQQRINLEAVRAQFCSSLRLLNMQDDAGMSLEKRKRECAAQIRKLLPAWSERARVALSPRFKSILEEFRWIDGRCGELMGAVNISHGKVMPSWLPYLDASGEKYLSVRSIELDVQGWQRKLWSDRVVARNRERFTACPGPEPAFPSAREQHVMALIGEFCQIVGLPVPEWNWQLFDAPLELAKHDSTTPEASLRAAAGGDASSLNAILANAQKSGWGGKECAVTTLALSSNKTQPTEPLSLDWVISNVGTATKLVVGDYRHIAVRASGSEIWLLLGS